MLGMDHGKIILLSTPFPITPVFGTSCSCNVIVFDVEINNAASSLVGNTWLQRCLFGPLSRYFLVGHRIFCLLSFLLLVVVVMCYAL